ncbi:MAG: uL15m family ribosomal protein [Candidatus Nanohaloarchaea archaeon]
MVKRRSKKKKSGSHGHGSSKKNRGAGNRGGRGNAGRGKKAGHHKMEGGEVHELGEKGFNRHGSTEQDGINLRDIDQRIEEFVESGAAEETEDGYVFHADRAGYDKVLGTGKLTREIEIRAEEFSDSAERKIEETGAEPVEIEE